MDQEAHAMQMAAVTAAEVQLAIARGERAVARVHMRLLACYLDEADEAALGVARTTPVPPRDPDAELELLKAVVVAAESEEARAEVVAAIDRFAGDMGEERAAPARRLYALCWTPEPPRVAP
jgi:hypothetical protein